MKNNNIFVTIPKRGDIWLRKITTKEDCFIELEILDMASVDTSSYEILGVVAHVDKNGILVVYKENENKQFFNRCWWYLSGYTLDGTERTGTISARFSSNNWSANIEKTITYQSDNIEDFVAALNAVFTTDTDFSADDWEASVIGGKVRLTANAVWKSFAYTTALNGFVLSCSAPEFTHSSRMFRKKNILAEKTGKEITSFLSKMRYNSPKVQNGTFSPACDYAASIATATVSEGELYVPSKKELCMILRDVKYGTSYDVNSDVLNEALNLIGGKSIKNTNTWWSCCRYNSCYGWLSYGLYVWFHYNFLSYPYGVVPVLHLNFPNRP